MLYLKISVDENETLLLVAGTQNADFVLITD